MASPAMHAQRQTPWSGTGPNRLNNPSPTLYYAANPEPRAGMPVLKRRPEQIEILCRVSLFAPLSKRELNEVARRAREVAASAGDVLTEEGTEGTDAFVIVKGSVSVRLGDRKLATCGAGDVIGEMSLIDRQPRSATVIADEDCALLVVSRRDFGKLLEQMPRLSRKLLVELSRRIREADELMAGLKAPSAAIESLRKARMYWW